MTPLFLDKFSPNPLVEGNQDQSSLSPFTLAAAHASSFSFPFFLTTPQYQGLSQMDHHPQQQQQQQQPLHQEPLNLLMIGTGSSDTTTNNDQNVADGDHVDSQGSGKWMSSKMRIMRKMMNSDDGRRLVMSKPRRNFRLVQDQPPNDQGGIVRVCSDCNTTKTPLWRSGPRGPKSLCNACGIRQRKARRAMAAKGLVENDTASTKARKEKRSYNIVDRSTLPFKKRCKITISSETSNNNKKKKLRFNDVAVRFSKNSAFHRVFPKDERDAAVLLMALSCGLIRG